ncbi:MAG: IS110 family transposase, partial [Chloroflexota bacterium]|nr:IS110 family transposase [Chloroflexota bacterium]
MLANALITDRQVFQLLATTDSAGVECFRCTRGRPRNLPTNGARLGNRLRGPLWRNFPQLLEISDNVTETW